MTTATTLTRGETAELHALERKLERELDALRLAGLGEGGRALGLADERDAVRARIRQAKEARRDASLDKLRRTGEARARHDARERYDAEKADARQAAAEWLRGRLRLYGGTPRPAAEVEAAARAEGVDPDVLRQVSVRLLRRGTLAPHLATRDGAWLGRDFMPDE